MENQENSNNSPVEHTNIENNDTPEVQSADTPKAKTKKSKWESESEHEEPESERRLNKKRRGVKKYQKSVDSEVEEYSQPETIEKRLKVSNEDSFNQSPSIQSVSPIAEPINDMSV